MSNAATLTRLFHGIAFHISASTELKPSLRKRIKAAGGDYSDVRGAYTTTRFITLRTADMALVNEIFETLAPHSVVLTDQTYLAAACYDTAASAAERGIRLYIVDTPPIGSSTPPRARRSPWTVCRPTSTASSAPSWPTPRPSWPPSGPSSRSRPRPRSAWSVPPAWAPRPKTS